MPSRLSTLPPEEVHKISSSGEAVPLQYLITRWEETGLGYLDNFDYAYKNMSRKVPRPENVKIYSAKSYTGHDVSLKSAHYLQLPDNDRPLLLGHVVMQIVHAQFRDYQAVVYNTIVQARLKGRSITPEEARVRAGLPQLKDIHLVAILRVKEGGEEWWYPRLSCSDSS